MKFKKQKKLDKKEIKAYLTIEEYLKIQKLFYCSNREYPFVFYNGKEKYIYATDGAILRVEENIQVDVPFDSVFIKGSFILNKKMLCHIYTTDIMKPSVPIVFKHYEHDLLNLKDYLPMRPQKIDSIHLSPKIITTLLKTFVDTDELIFKFTSKVDPIYIFNSNNEFKGIVMPVSPDTGD